ncbi:MAG: hypothetical protein Q9171_005656 [Xanthocarpia ochracea]
MDKYTLLVGSLHKWRDCYGNQMDLPAVTVHECREGGFCCGENNSTCCGTSDARYIVDGRVTNINPNSTTTSSAPSSSTSTANPVSGQPNRQEDAPPLETQQPASGGTNVGAIAGGVVGGVVVALASITAALWFFFFSKRRAHTLLPPEKQYHNDLAHDSHHQLSIPPPALQDHVQPGVYEVEAPGPSQLDSQQTYEIGHRM